MDFESIAKLRRYLSVKHHIPGRIRIGFSPKLAMNKQALALAKDQRELPPGVHNARLNMQARSVVIEYDPERIDPEILQELASTKDDRKAQALVEKLHTILQGTTPKEDSK
jgi:allophanate hydrolase subunit 1